MSGILLSIASILIAINCISNRNRILDLENKMRVFELRIAFILNYLEAAEREGTQHD